MIVNRPSLVVSPAMSIGDPLGFAGNRPVGAPEELTYRNAIKPSFNKLLWIVLNFCPSFTVGNRHGYSGIVHAIKKKLKDFAVFLQGLRGLRIVLIYF